MWQSLQNSNNNNNNLTHKAGFIQDQINLFLPSHPQTPPQQQPVLQAPDPEHPWKKVADEELKLHHVTEASDQWPTSPQTHKSRRNLLQQWPCCNLLCLRLYRSSGNRWFLDRSGASRRRLLEGVLDLDELSRSNELLQMEEQKLTEIRKQLLVVERDLEKRKWMDTQGERKKNLGRNKNRGERKEKINKNNDVV